MRNINIKTRRFSIPKLIYKGKSNMFIERSKMKYTYHEHVDSFVCVPVEANTEEEAEERGKELIENMPDSDYDKQLKDNAQPGESWLTEGE